MEDHVTWSFEPLDLVWVLAVSFHDSIKRRLFLVKLENELGFFNGQVWAKFHWGVWNDNIVLCHHEIVDHSWAGNRDYSSKEEFSVLVKKRIENFTFSILTLHAISEAKELTGFSIYFRMCRNVVF